ncbi:polysaccharide deacetylase family protein [Paenibacillus sp. M1]|uniref:Polysaccharide deacetylase family protein n=1 Tax=Paenibacillus haidiansis TaxID=1574488 RepID=A0ABU7VS59_9BACL
MKPFRTLAACLLAITLCQGCGQNPGNSNNNPEAKSQKISQADLTNLNPRLGGTPELQAGAEGNVRKPHPMSLADLHKKYPTYYVLNGPRSKRQVALTFDDAPDNVFTPQVLDALKAAGVKATFFVIGNRAEAHPDIMARIVREGHVVGNHSYSHPNLPKLADPRFREEVTRTDRIIRSYTGSTPTLFRPPYGNTDENQILWLTSLGKRIVGWNVDSLDWKGLDADQVSTNILGHILPGSIILQHAAGGEGEDLSGTVAAIPRIVKSLKKDGVEFVTVDTLLNVKRDKESNRTGSKQ